jgi:peroxiredoxin
MGGNRKRGMRAVLLAMAIGLLPAVRSSQGAGPGGTEKAPDFSLKDLKGTEVRLSDSRGRAVLLVFSASWCPYCRREIPELKKLHDRFKDRGLDLIMVDVRESHKKVASFAARYEIPYRVLLDEEGKVARQYGVRGIPDELLIGKDGGIVCRRCPSVEKEIEKLLK